MSVGSVRTGTMPTQSDFSPRVKGNGVERSMGCSMFVCLGGMAAIILLLGINTYSGVWSPKIAGVMYMISGSIAALSALCIGSAASCCPEKLQKQGQKGGGDAE